MSFVPIVVTEDYSSPDGLTPDGSVSFQLTESMSCGPIVVGSLSIDAELDQGQLSQILMANDTAGIVPSTTAYQVVQNVEGAAPASFYIVVPSQPVGSRSVTDGVVVLSSGILNSLTADFTGDDVGTVVLCDAFPVGSTITSVIDAADVEISGPSSLTATGLSVLVGASVTLSSLDTTA